MSHPSHRGRRRMDAATRRFASRLTLLVSSLLLALGLAPALSQAATATVTQSDLCNAWNADASSPEVTLASGYKITGSKLSRSGASCGADDAAVSFTDSAITEVTTSGTNGTAVSRMLASVVQTAVSTNDVKVGDEVFKGATIKSLTAVLQNGFVGIKGGLEITWSGGTVTKLQFSGRFYATDRYSLVLTSPIDGSVLPNIGGDPINFTGDLVRDSTGYHMNLTGTASSIVLGTGDQQLTLANAALKLTLANVQTGDGLRLSASGDVALGSAVKLTGAKIDAEFDSTGLLKFDGTGALDATIPANGSSPEGSVKGNATIAYARDGAQSVAFKGDVKFGDALVANAEGTLDAQSVTFTGDVTLTNADLTVKGGVDGVAFYGDDLTGRTIQNRAGAQVQAQKGDALVKSASASIEAKNLDVKGSAQLGDVAGEQWAKASGAVDLTFSVSGLPDTNLKGTADLDWVKGQSPSVGFKGAIASGSTAVASAEGTVDGNKLSLKGEGTLSNPDLTVKGSVDGVVYYGDGSGDQIANHAGDKVAAKKGDFVLKSATAKISSKGFELSGAASMARVGGDRWASGGGDVDLTLGQTNLKGHADMTWSAGEVPAVQFAGSMKQGDTAVANVEGTVDGNKLAFKGDASLATAGLTAKGAVDGIVYYGTDLSGLTVIDATGKEVAAKKGDYVIKSASGEVNVKNLTLGGTVSLGSVGGKQWANAGGTIDLTSGDTTLKGSADVAWVTGQTPTVRFEGTVKSFATTVRAAGTLDGKKLTIAGDGTFATAAISLQGDFAGTVYYGDPAGDTLPNVDGIQVPAKKGDFALKASADGQMFVWNTLMYGDFAVTKAGGDTYASGGGGVSISSAGNKVTGTGSFTWQEEQYPVLTFAGSIAMADGSAVANASGTLDGRKVTFKGDATVKQPTYTLSGAAEGTMYYGNPGTRKIESKDGTMVVAKKGDYIVKTASGKLETQSTTITGKLSAGKAQGIVWLNAGGTIDTTFGNPATTIKGSATYQTSTGGSPVLTFDGTVTTGTTVLTGKGEMDGKKIALTGSASYTSPALTIKGSIDGIVYYGDPAGATLADATGKQVAAQKGDFVVKSATGSVTVQNLDLSGNVTLGKVGGSLYASGGGSVDLTSGATNLKGSATFTWATGQSPVVTFDGTVTSGNTVLTGKGSLDGKKVALKGSAKSTETGYSLEGAIDGVVYYGDPAGDTITDATGKQVPAAKGDYYLASATGSLTAKGTTLTGNLSAGSIAGQKWAKGGGTIDTSFGTPATTIKGSATFTWATGTTGSLAFDGTVTSGTTIITGKGEMDGKKIALKGTAKSSDASFTLEGSLDGAVYYGDPAGDTITNQAGQKVAASKGDYYLASATGTLTTKGTTVSGNVSAGKVGSATWVTAGGSIDTTFGNPATTIRGSASFTWSNGSAGAIMFDGTITSGSTVLTGKGEMDGKKIALTGSASYTSTPLTLKGSIDGVVYYADPAGDTLPDATGKQVTAQKGDFVVKSATGSVTAQNLSLSGNVSLGKVGGTLYASGGGNVDLSYNGTALKGSATFAWVNGQTPSVTFDGSITSGTTVINGKGSLDGKKIALKGDVKITDPSYTLTGAIDGVVFYGDPAGDTITNQAGQQVAATKGDFYVASASGSLTTKGTTLSGNVSAGKVGSSMWVKGAGSVDMTFGSPTTTIKGSATFALATGGTGSLAFEGTVTQGDYKLSGSGVMDGKKLAFSGSLASPTLSGDGSGVVYYGSDLSGETIKNRSGATVAASRGDFLISVTNGKAVMKQITATADFTLSKVGAMTWAKANAQIRVGTTWLTFSGEIDSTGYVNLQGAGSVVLDGYTVNFNGSAVIQNNALTLNGTVDVVTSLFGVRLTGTITKADMNSSAFTFVGKGSFRFGGYDIAGATIRFMTGEGITTSFEIKSCLLFLCTTGTYKLYFVGQEISKIQLSAPIASWPVFFGIAKITAPNIPVETTITGII